MTKRKTLRQTTVPTYAELSFLISAKAILVNANTILIVDKAISELAD
jgi:hypothetical protein